MSTRRAQPAYFAAVRSEAASNWDTLESNPVLAAPWRQLFRQVKSPYHVLSEVLQNADDAQATWARAWVEDGAFYFEHDGADFEAEHLQSLCRFGFSNKRRLHIIGFRGLGFKSLFSYGPRVELMSPTLAVAFDEARFTEPVWIDGAPPLKHTRIRVVLTDHLIEARVLEDLERWANNPVPLLFFHSIRELEVGGRTISRTDGEPGLAPGAVWVELRGAEQDRVLLVRSAEAEVPGDALDEIRQERGDPDFQLPGMAVDLVIGLPDPDRLYVVLPTNVELPVPFSCNAPFIQDPARSGIKDPANSPLNRWLLGRIGALAADTLVAWSGNDALSRELRAEAYDNLLPDGRPEGGSAGAVAGREITAAMAPVLAAAPVVLSADGTLVRGAEALDLPSAIAGVWPAPEALQTFGSGKTALVTAELTDRARQRLRFWAGLKRVSNQDMVERLRASAAVPRPALDQLDVLWAYLEPTISGNRWYDWVRELQIVPVSGDVTLGRATDVTNFGGGGSLEDTDWSFLRAHVRVVDPEWVARLQDARAAGGDATRELRASVSVLEHLKLDQPATIAQLVGRAASAMGASRDTAAGVRLAHIAARADVQVDGQFRYLMDSNIWRTADEGVVQRGGEHEDLLPEDWRVHHALHAAYEADLSPEMQKTWRAWIASGKSRVRAFPLPSARKETLRGRGEARMRCESRGNTKSLDFRLVTSTIEVDDHDFPAAFWSLWTALAKHDPEVWVRVVRAIGEGWGPAAEQVSSAALYQSSPNYRYKVTASEMPAAWLHRLRGLPCVADERGVPSVPDTLLRYTQDTAFMKGAEQFVHPSMDRHELQPLLELLGVRSHALSSDTLIARLRALAKAPTPPTHAVLPLYNALDQLVARLPAHDLRTIRDVFANEPLVLSEELTWHQAPRIYQRNDERLPAVATLWTPCAGLALWQRLGVPPRPSIEQLLAWLSALPSGERLDDVQRRRVRELLAVMPRQVWESCGAWLDLGGRWVSAPRFRWRAGRASSADGLFTKFRHATADLSMVDGALQGDLFTNLVSLEQVLARRAMPGVARQMPCPAWLELLAAAATQVTASTMATAADTAGAGHPDAAVARRLATSHWRVADQLAVTPFVGSEQAGAARSVRAVWDDDALYVCGSPAQYHRALVDEVSSDFFDSSLRNAVADCVGRDPEWVRDYLLDQFGVDALATAAQESASTADIAGTTPGTAEEATSGGPLEGALLAGPLPVTSAGPTRSAGGAAPRTTDTVPAEVSTGPASAAQSPSPVQRPSMVAAHERSAPRWRTAVTAILRELGFSELSETTWVHPDGGRAEVGGDLLHALATDAGGKIVARYWVGDGRLEDGVIVPAAVWNLMARAPNESWVVLPDDERALRGFSIQEIGGHVEVAAASYVVRLTGA